MSKQDKKNGNESKISILKQAVPNCHTNEEDIVASIFDHAQAHVRWIYDSTLTQMGLSKAIRLNEMDRELLRRKSLGTYMSYLHIVTCELGQADKRLK